MVLDKDIEILKERANEMLNGDYSRKIGDEELYTIICEWENSSKELETYKKIVEKLAITILEIDVEEKDVYETICKSTPNNRCEEFENGNCNQCILDWARKEVEK